MPTTTVILASTTVLPLALLTRRSGPANYSLARFHGGSRGSTRAWVLRASEGCGAKCDQSLLGGTDDTVAISASDPITAPILLAKTCEGGGLSGW
mmetsp:Transcript_5286/g.10762  ORF Transcript_5286/g.10762 Transcript_5286/m.10762 type:complete len:95 (-) Transcript_5286:298-582(-)